MGAAFARPLLFPCRPGAERPRFNRQAKCALRLTRARAIRRANRAGADTRPRRHRRAHDTRESGSRCSGRPAAGRTKQEGRTICRMLTDTASRRQAGRSNTPLPLALPHAHISFRSVTAARPFPIMPSPRHTRTCSGYPCGRPAEAVAGDTRNKSGYDEGVLREPGRRLGYAGQRHHAGMCESGSACGRGRKRSGPHAPDGYRICAMRMQNMTSHDISQELLPALMTKHDIS